MELLGDYLLFLGKTVTLLAFIGIFVAIVASLGKQSKDEPGELCLTDLGQRFKDYREALEELVLSEEDLKAKEKQAKADAKAEKKAKKSKDKAEEEEKPPKKRIFVLDFDGDIRASEVESLRTEITALLTLAKPEDEIILRLESGGGLVHAYGLAASQLQRIRQRGVRLVVSVDKVAASGGYMMACVADHIIAAPFAIIGSIGVLAQIPNFHRLLQKHEVDFEQHTAGEYKRTLTLFGENTDEARAKFNEELEETHVLFKQFVAEHRSQLDIDKVATGEHWYGSQAVALGLVDELLTSDDYLLNASKDADIYAISYEAKRSLFERLGIQVQLGVERFFTFWQSRNWESRLFK